LVLPHREPGSPVRPCTCAHLVPSHARSPASVACRAPPLAGGGSARHAASPPPPLRPEGAVRRTLRAPAAGRLRGIRAGRAGARRERAEGAGPGEGLEGARQRPHACRPSPVKGLAREASGVPGRSGASDPVEGLASAPLSLALRRGPALQPTRGTEQKGPGIPCRAARRAEHGAGVEAGEECGATSALAWRRAAQVVSPERVTR